MSVRAPDRKPPDAQQLEAAERYALQNRLVFAFGQLTTESMRAVVDLVGALTRRDAQAIGRYAKALADWPDPDASSEG